ncbi:MAG: GFA family protein [Candidatus Thiodiazotropha sp. (ex. Lucinoma kazani)]
MKIEGKCHCGEITFSAEVEPDQVFLCHCLDCQALSGSSFRTNIRAIEGTFKIESGAPKIYVKTAEDGAKRAQAFCPNCGSPIYAGPEEDLNLQYVNMRVGLIKQKSRLKPNKQIWCRSSLEWIQELSDIQKNETE